MVAETRAAARRREKLTTSAQPRRIGRNGTMAHVIPSATGQGKRTIFSYDTGYDDRRRAPIRSPSVETELEEEQEEEGDAQSRFVTPHPSTAEDIPVPMAPKKIVQPRCATCRPPPPPPLFMNRQQDAVMVDATPTPSPVKRPMAREDTVIDEAAAAMPALGSPFTLQTNAPAFGSIASSPLTPKPRPLGPCGTEVIEENLDMPETGTIVHAGPPRPRASPLKRH